MELVEGQTLAQRIERGALELEEAIDIVTQVAAGLDAAHAKGIIHRDLKPANVMITEDGTVKVLDFGLAKALEGDAAESVEDSNSPTLSRAATQAGVLLGTAGYMSPEQARGKPVDKRADIWALGVVLFEMLTGTRLFHGETMSDTLAAVLKTEPDWTALPAETPWLLKRLLRRCLEKNQKERLHDVADVRLELQDAMTSSDEAPRNARRPASPFLEVRWSGCSSASRSWHISRNERRSHRSGSRWKCLCWVLVQGKSPFHATGEALLLAVAIRPPCTTAHLEHATT